MNEEKMLKLYRARKVAEIDTLMSVAFSVFGMLLIFGLGFVYPTVNPYVVIKWIVVVAGVMFVLAFVKYLLYTYMEARLMWTAKKAKTSASALNTKSGSKTNLKVKAKKTSKK